MNKMKSAVGGKRNRILWPVVLLLVLAGCSPFHLIQSESAYEKGIKAYLKFTNETDSTGKNVYKHEAIEYLDKSLTESKNLMQTDPGSDKGYLFYMKASILLSQLDYNNGQTYVENGLKVAQAFRTKTINTLQEACWGEYYFAKFVAGWTKADSSMISEAIYACQFAREHLPLGPEKAECVTILEALQFRLNGN